MAFSGSVPSLTGPFQLAGGAVADLFAAQADPIKYGLQAKGVRLQGQGLRIRAQGDTTEAQNYDMAAVLARKNVEYTKQSTAIQQMQLDRQITLSLGGQQADVAGAGLKSSGTALDLLRDSASQGALAKDVLARQGEITEAGYEEQAKSYENMSSYGRWAASQEEDIAGKTEAMAGDYEKLGALAQKADYFDAIFKGAAAVASLAAPAETSPRPPLPGP